MVNYIKKTKIKMICKPKTKMIGLSLYEI